MAERTPVWPVGSGGSPAQAPANQPIPDALWVRVLEFLAAGKTGEVVLYVKAGQVINGRLTEHLPRVLDSA